jgi:Zn-dependent peptidase ImmA (M78 family)
VARKALRQAGIDVDEIDTCRTDGYIDVDEIARKLGIDVKYHSFSDSISGLFSHTGDRRTIAVNDGHNSHRQRFSIAHEIGHYLLHSEESLHYDTGKLEEIYFRADNVVDYSETEANRFAAELLMPAELVRRCVEEGIRSVEELASRFDVSPEAMRYRLVNLGYL